MKALKIGLYFALFSTIYSCSEQTGFELPKSGKYDVYDVLGAKVSSGEGDVVPTDSLTKGVYFVVVDGDKWKFEKE